MTLQQLEQFRGQIQAQIAAKQAQSPVPGQELFYHLGAIELQTGLNLVNQLITMEQVALAAPPGPLGPAI